MFRIPIFAETLRRAQDNRVGGAFAPSSHRTVVPPQSSVCVSKYVQFAEIIHLFLDGESWAFCAIFCPHKH